MKKILTAQQTRQADTYTIENEPILSIDLMERASSAFVEELKNHISQTAPIYIFCGNGNNGGDGFAIARLLKQEEYTVHCFAIGKGNVSPDCDTNMDRFAHYRRIETEASFPKIENNAIIIDAIFGSGLSRPIEGLASIVIEKINASNAFVVSVDIPSGMYCDAPFTEGIAICADVVISFQRPKLSFFMPESSAFIKRWMVTDIGLDETFIQQQDSKNFILDNTITNRILPRKRYSHKGTYGHVLTIAGSYGMMGAAQLASRAALKSGAGLVTSYCPQYGYQIMQIAVPECLCLTDRNQAHLSTIPELGKYSTVVVGPGIGTASETEDAVKQLLEQCQVPLVLDADALTIIANNKGLLEILPKMSILTPHPKEFERLVGKWDGSQQRMERQRQFSKTHTCFVIYKDAHTTISTPEGDLYFNTSGNPGMATAGSGDVLAGVVGALLAQSYSPLDACLIGVYEHGRAGDRAAQLHGQSAVVASDILSQLRIGS